MVLHSFGNREDANRYGNKRDAMARIGTCRYAMKKPRLGRLYLDRAFLIAPFEARGRSLFIKSQIAANDRLLARDSGHMTLSMDTWNANKRARCA